jgi:hypothetical protein
MAADIEISPKTPFPGFECWLEKSLLTVFLFSPFFSGQFLGL